MAVSTCVKCGGKSFELKPAKPKDSNFKLYFVQCASCGGVVGTQEFQHTGATLQQHGQALKAIAQKVGVSVKIP